MMYENTIVKAEEIKNETLNNTVIYKCCECGEEFPMPEKEEDWFTFCPYCGMEINWCSIEEYEEAEEEDNDYREMIDNVYRHAMESGL